MTSSRPYLLRAVYEWIVDNHLTPHIIVNAQMPQVNVPEKYVQDGRIVLNVSTTATQKLLINNEAVEFDARFGDAIWHIYTPIPSVLAIYARENGRGMIFDEEGDGEDDGEGAFPISSSTPSHVKTKSKPNLKIVK